MILYLDHISKDRIGLRGITVGVVSWWKIANGLFYLHLQFNLLLQLLFLHIL